MNTSYGSHSLLIERLDNTGEAPSSVWYGGASARTNRNGARRRGNIQRAPSKSARTIFSARTHRAPRPTAKSTKPQGSTWIGWAVFPWRNGGRSLETRQRRVSGSPNASWLGKQGCPRRVWIGPNAGWTGKTRRRWWKSG